MVVIAYALINVLRLHPPAADHGRRPRHQPGRRDRRDPRLDGVHRPGRCAARGAAHAGAAGRGSCRSRAPAGSSRSSGRCPAKRGATHRSTQQSLPCRTPSPPISRRDRSSPPAAAWPTRRRGRAHGSTIGTPTARASSTPPGGAIVVNVGHGRRESPRPWRTRPVGSPMPTARPSRPSRSRPTPPRSGRTCPSRSRPSTPSVAARRRWRPRSRWPALPPCPRRVGALDRRRPLGQLSRQHARRARPLRPPAASAPVRGLARPLPTRQRRVPLPCRRTRAEAIGDAAEPADELEQISSWPARHRGRLRRGADRGRHAGRRGAARWLLAGDRGGLSPLRRAAHRRRGDDRLRADRDLVRDGPLRRSPGHPGRRQGRDSRVLAVRLRGGQRRGRRRLRAAASPTASPTRITRSAPRSPARCCGS